MLTRLIQRWRRRGSAAMDRGRLRLSATRAELLLSALGALVGLLAGAVILAFRFVVDLAQSGYLSSTGGFEALPPMWRLWLPLLGGLLIGIYLQWLARLPPQGMGVAHVIERVSFHQGYLPWQNALHQFIGGALALISGHSVGREGPSVHLGAACGSLLGQGLRLPHNSMRVLVACGCAAAIAASFDTPLAGVAFAMEVIVMEYTVAGFLPVILAAVCGAALVQAVYGPQTAFVVPPLAIELGVDLPWVLITGLVMGALAALIIQCLEWFQRLRRPWPLWLRSSLGGLGVGLCALQAPEVLGIGYTTVNQILQGALGPWLLLKILGLKLIASTLVVGMGSPGGLIAPSLVIGAAAGAAAGALGRTLFDGGIGSNALYVVVGMAAVMGAVLRAPLAALTALLELTGNPAIILPGLLAIVAAVLVTSEGLRKCSIFRILLQGERFERERALRQHGLARQGVAALMDRRVVALPARVESEALRAALRQEPRWIVVASAANPDMLDLIPVADARQYIEQSPEAPATDLTEIPAQRLEGATVDLRATLGEALEVLEERDAEALVVTSGGARRRLFGVITRQELAGQSPLPRVRRSRPDRW